MKAVGLSRFIPLLLSASFAFAEPSVPEPDRWTPSYNVNDIRPIGVPRWEKEIGRLVAEWNRAFNQGRVKPVLKQFDPPGFLTDSRAVEEPLRKALAGYPKNSEHEFSVADIWFIWKATEIYIRELSPELLTMVALVHIDHKVRPAGKGSEKKERFVGIVRRIDDRWKWFSVWAADPRPNDPLDGTVWSVPQMHAREDEFIVFEDGRFISGTASAKGLGSAVYSAEERGSAIVWSARHESSNGASRAWEGKVEGGLMTGRDRFRSPTHGIDESWDWQAAKLNLAAPRWGRRSRSSIP